MERTLKIVLGVMVLLTIVYNSLFLNGSLSFGAGLGDAFYFIIFLAIQLVLIVTALIGLRKKNKKLALFSVIILGIIFLYILFGLTINRGPEQPWDGSIFV